ncbi:MAG: hypothetical protein O2820_11890 [Planctomycetota bacterium]|nr:hypothetical protein [Planctomycetota bacterium]
MNIEMVLVLLALFSVFGVVLWGLFAEQRTAAVGAVAVLLAVIAAGCAWYAWAESRSIPWTIGYGILFAVCAASAIRQLSGGDSR